MHPDGGGSRPECRHVLREQAADHSGKHIAGTCGAEPGRRIVRDRGATVRMRDDRIGALEHQDCAGDPRRFARTLHFRKLAQVSEQARELTIMRSEDDRAGGSVGGCEQPLLLSGETGQRVGVEDARAGCSAWAKRGCGERACLFTDSQTGRTLVSQLLGTTSLSAFTDDDGATYTVSQGGGIASGVDHQTIGGGPFRSCTTAQTLANPTACAPLAARGPLTAYPNAVYYASQDLGDAAMALSQTGGLTYEEAHPMYTLVQCGGLHGHIKVSNSGIVYVPNARCNGTQGLIVSMDNGLTFTVNPVTGSTSGTSDPSVGIGAKDRVYFGYTSRDGHPHITVSDDQGRSWHDDNDVGLPFQIQNAAFPEVVAGDNDRAAFFFLGTPSAGDGTGSDAGTPFNGVWHGYFATTYDGGKTWFTVDATPNDPVQLGVVCTQGTGCPAGTRNLLDFNDITVDKNGRVLAAFTDGCITAACIAKGNNASASHTKADNDGATKATIIRQATGLGLFQSQDSPPLQP